MHTQTDTATATAASQDKRARELLRKVFGYAEFRSRQQQIIEQVCRGGDALVLMPTGGGKSLCYQLPALIMPGLCIVISPLIALMHDQVRALAELGVEAACLNSTLTPAEQAEVISRAQTGSLDLLYVAPERILQEATLHRAWQLHRLSHRHRRSALRVVLGT